MNGPVLMVVVLYGISPRDSVTVQGVAAALGADAGLRAGFEVLLWDNSAVKAVDVEMAGLHCLYEHATANDGIAGAVNGVMELCIQNGYEWMLLLDQDTRVSPEYLAGMLRRRSEVGGDEGIAAIVPVLCEEDVQLSPQQVLRFRQAPVRPEPERVLDGEVFAANSGVMLRVAALAAVGGYSVDFWLDHSDMYVFHQLYLRGWKVFLAGELRLQHSMTMQDYDGRMTPGRYENFLNAEQAFLDLYKNRPENLVHALRMMARVVRQRRYRNKIYSRMTLKFLLGRLVHGKSARLRAWKARAVARHAASTGLKAEV